MTILTLFWVNVLAFAIFAVVFTRSDLLGFAKDKPDSP